MIFSVIHFATEHPKWYIRCVVILWGCCISNEEANFIAEIPISRTHTNDRIIWHYDAKGNYTVKSGYRQALKWSNFSVNEVASSSSFHNPEFWKKVWNIKVMPKIKTFWWRVCSNALATRENLYKRNCSSSPLCQICNSQVETIEHMFFECPWTKSMWFGSNYGLRANNLSGDFISRISSLIDIFPSKSQALKLLASIAITSWNICKARNKFIFEHTPLCLSQVISALNVMQSEFASVSSLSPTPSSLVHSHSSQESSPKWVPPTSNVVKLNCDGVFKSNQGAIGIVARDSE
ncbi:ribonuclease H-like superfamily protein [Tanacetum coccineum]